MNKIVDVINFIQKNERHFLETGIKDIHQIPFRCNSSNDILKLIISNEIETKHLIIKMTFFDSNYNEAYIEHINLKRCNNFFKTSTCQAPKLLESPIEMGVLITEEVSGITCKKMIVSNCNFFSSQRAKSLRSWLISNCGKWLREYHIIGNNQLDSIRAQANILEYSNSFILTQRILIQNICDKSPLLKTIVHKYGLQLDDNLNQLFNVEPTLIHGDFGPGNILTDGTNITVLDFSYLVYLSKYFDVGQFLASLDTINPYPQNFLYNKNLVNKLKEIFLANYFKANSVNIGCLEYIETFYALNILRQYNRHTQFVSKRFGNSISKIFDAILAHNCTTNILKNSEFLRNFASNKLS